MIENIFNNILQLSIMGGMLALIVIIIRTLTKNHLPKKVFYLMWIMVFIKFVLPIDLSAPINIWGDVNIEATTTNIVRNRSIMVHERNLIEQPIERRRVQPVTTTGGSTIEENGDNISKEMNYTSPIEKGINIFPIVWFVGMITFLGVLIILYFIINKRFKYAQTVELDFIRNILDGKNSRIKVYKDNNTSSPMVLGIVRPKIILPEDFDMREEKMLTHIILHEVQHIKWKDSLINVISLIILSIHWFNPLLWISYILFSRDIEVFCDERVLRHIGENKKSEYADSLLSCAVGKRKFAPVCTCSFGENNVKERIKGVMKYKKIGVITGIIAIVLIAIVSIIFTTNGTNETRNGKKIDIPDSDAPYQSIEKEKTELEKLVEKSNRINVLLMGLEGTRTDTMILVSFDPDSKDVDLISIPRDTYYYIKGYDSPDQKKINAIYGRKKADGGGPQGVIKVVSDILKVPVDYYATLSYEGVESIVNSLGGVEVNIPFDMDYDDLWAKPQIHIHLKKGTQKLNGKESMQFLRYRQNNDNSYSDGDNGRINRQQQFIKAAANKALSFKLPDVANTTLKHVKTNMKYDDIANYLARIIGISMEDIETYKLPGNPEGSMSYYIHDVQKTEELMLQIYKKGLDD